MVVVASAGAVVIAPASAVVVAAAGAVIVIAAGTVVVVAGVALAATAIAALPFALALAVVVTVAAADTAARFYAARHGLPLIVARPANHIGPGQSPRFVSSAFARQPADIAAGRAPPEMRVGNLDSRRNFTDVRDVVNAYLLLLERGIPGAAYNIASPASVSIRDLLDVLCDISGVRPALTVDPSLWRPTDAHPAYSTARIHADTGWTPAIPLRQTLLDLYRCIAEA